MNCLLKKLIPHKDLLHKERCKQSSNQQNVMKKASKETRNKQRQDQQPVHYY